MNAGVSFSSVMSVSNSKLNLFDLLFSLSSSSVLWNSTEASVSLPDSALSSLNSGFLCKKAKSEY